MGIMGRIKKNNNNNDPTQSESDKVINKMDITNQNNFNFSKSDLIEVKRINECIKTEIYNLNEYITNIIVKYYENFGSSSDPQKREYEFTYEDFRYLYEELLNLIVIDYMIHVKLAKRFYIKSEPDKFPFLDTNSYNPVDLDFDIKMMYSSSRICQDTSDKYFNEMKDIIDSAIGRLTVYNNKIAEIIMRNYLNETKTDKISINQYLVFFNQQYTETLSKIFIVSNICKHHWFKMMALRSINKVDEKLV
jgi:hypothetical protein